MGCECDFFFFFFFFGGGVSMQVCIDVYLHSGATPCFMHKCVRFSVHLLLCFGVCLTVSTSSELVMYADRERFVEGG